MKKKNVTRFLPLNFLSCSLSHHYPTPVCPKYYADIQHYRWTCPDFGSLYKWNHTIVLFSISFCLFNIMFVRFNLFWHVSVGLPSYCLRAVFLNHFFITTPQAAISITPLWNLIPQIYYVSLPLSYLSIYHPFICIYFYLHIVGISVYFLLSKTNFCPMWR